ncbi:hypothetical protein WT37_04315 [Burkholderia territorii]|nr:hypothetical protein WT37_04315 [Burkholderia territorii]
MASDPAWKIIVPQEALLAVASVQAVQDEAERRANMITEAAYAKLSMIERDAASKAECEIWARAGAALEALAQLETCFKDKLEHHMQAILETLIDRLNVEVSEKARLVSSVRTLLQETKITGAAVLMVAKEDWENASDELSALTPFTVEIDASLIAGECCLCVGQGESRASFDGSIKALLAAIRSNEYDATCTSIQLNR